MMKYGLFLFGLLGINVGLSHLSLANLENQDVFNQGALISCSTSEPQPEKKDGNRGNRRT